MSLKTQTFIHQHYPTAIKLVKPKIYWDSGKNYLRSLQFIQCLCRTYEIVSPVNSDSDLNAGNVINIQIILAFVSSKLGMDTPLSIRASGCPSWMSYRMKQTHAMVGLITSKIMPYYFINLVSQSVSFATCVTDDFLGDKQ